MKRTRLVGHGHGHENELPQVSKIHRQSQFAIVDYRGERKRKVGEAAAAAA